MQKYLSTFKYKNNILCKLQSTLDDALGPTTRSRAKSAGYFLQCIIWKNKSRLQTKHFFSRGLGRMKDSLLNGTFACMSCLVAHLGWNCGSFFLVNNPDQLRFESCDCFSFRHSSLDLCESWIPHAPSRPWRGKDITAKENDWKREENMKRAQWETKWTPVMFPLETVQSRNKDEVLFVPQGCAA